MMPATDRIPAQFTLFSNEPVGGWWCAYLNPRAHYYAHEAERALCGARGAAYKHIVDPEYRWFCKRCLARLADAGQ